MDGKALFPPAAAAGRRGFMRQVCSTALLGAGGLALAGCSSTGGSPGEHAAASFGHGVASGDPLTDRVILWTRVTPHPAPQGAGEAADIAVRWWVATDPAMQAVVAGGTAVANAGADYTVKVDAAGLLPGHVYYYQFAADTVKSPVGRTRTLP
ncbi:MAG: PhoD-like phosphatase N-terminal domain-containing protein, partial [Pseudomonadota bacterium]